MAEKIGNHLKQEVSDSQRQISKNILTQISQLIDKVKTDNQDIPVILVGGGSPILPDQIAGASEIIRPNHYEVANAYGACIAQIGGEAEKVFNLASISREEAIEEVKQAAIKQAISDGAIPESIELIRVSDTPLAYLPNATKVKVKVCGDLA